MEASTAAAANGLRSSLQGQVVIAGDAEYDEARKVFNGRVDKHPAVVTKVASTADVVAAVRFAREHELPIAVRCGGHSTAGFSSCDDGLVIDLSGMKGVEVDPAE